MNNQRYDKLNALIYLQNQKSHYKRILEAKKNISFQEGPTLKTYTHLKSKFASFQEKQRKQNNLKLVSKIGQINNGHGVLQKVQIEGKKYKYGREAFDKSYQHKFIQSQVNSENIRIAKKLRSIKPIVGTKKQWKGHYKTVKSLQQKLRKHSLSKEYDPEPKLKETLSSFKIHSNEERCLLQLSKLCRSNDSSQISIRRNSSNRDLKKKMKKTAKILCRKTQRISSSNENFNKLCDVIKTQQNESNENFVS